MTGRAGAVLAGVVAVAVLAVLAGCGTASAPSVDARLSASVIQQRTDVAPGRLQIHLENTGSADVRIVGAEVASPSFADAAVWPADRRVVLGAGNAVNLPVAIPAAACDAAPAPVVTVHVARADAADGAAGTALEIDATDPAGILAQLADAGCVAADVARRTTLELDDALVVDDGTAIVTLRWTPVSGATGTVTIDSVSSTTLLAAVGADGHAAQLAAVDVDATAASGSVDLRFRPVRCEAHAVAEDKQGTILRLGVTIDGAEDAVVALPASETLRSALYDYVTETCGLAAGAGDAGGDGD